MLVLEAGGSEAFDDPNIDLPLQFAHVIGNPKVRILPYPYLWIDNLSSNNAVV